MTVEQLARALYMTNPGTGGYPALHESLPWSEIAWKAPYRDRAREMLRLVAESDVRALPTTPKETNEHA